MENNGNNNNHEIDIEVNGSVHKRRQIITHDILKRIRKALDRSDTVKSIAEDTDISLQTAYKLVSMIAENFSNEEILGQKKGRRKENHDDIKSKITQILLRDSSIIQKEMTTELEVLGINKSQSTVSRIIKDMNYSRKRLIRIPEERNSVRNIEARQNYALEINHINNGNMVFLDETGVNLHQTRKYGYSPINTKAYKLVRANRGTNISCLVAINIYGIISYEIKSGSFDGTSFINFINAKLSIHFQAHPNDILIMDNCRFHHRRDVILLLQEMGIAYRFTPPYSPQLNPIEEYFSHFKALLSPLISTRTNSSELIIIVKRVLDNENISFDGWFLNMRRFIEKALARQEFI